MGTDGLFMFLCYNVIKPSLMSQDLDYLGGLSGVFIPALAKGA